MRQALCLAALVVDGLCVALLLIILSFGRMDPPGVIVSWVFIAILAINAAAIVVCWRSRTPKPDDALVAKTFD